MTIEEQVYTLLSSTPGITALVTPDKIKVPGPWENLARPYIIHQPITVTPNYTMDGLVALKCWDSYQLDCYADSYSVMRGLAQAVVAALSGQHNGITFFWRDQRIPAFDSAVRVFMVSLDFEVYEAL